MTRRILPILATFIVKLLNLATAPHGLELLSEKPIPLTISVRIQLKRGIVFRGSMVIEFDYDYPVFGVWVHHDKAERRQIR